jgi:hypothetical protein
VFKSYAECQKHIDIDKMAVLKNCGMKTVAVQVEIVDVEKFSAVPGIGFFYGTDDDCELIPRYLSDWKGNKISDEPFKKGDVVFMSVLYPVGCESSNNSAFEEREGVRFLKVYPFEEKRYDSTDNLCPHMAVIIESDDYILDRICLYNYKPKKGIFPTCSYDFYRRSGAIFATLSKLPEKVQESCPLHYTCEEIEEKIKAFCKYAVECFEESQM